jgi:hypothetical protein
VCCWQFPSRKAMRKKKQWPPVTCCNGSSAMSWARIRSSTVWIAALIALAAVTIMGTIGNSIAAVFTNVNSNLQAASGLESLACQEL